MENKIIISVAVTGSRPTKEMNPAVPYAPKEIADAAVESHRAGAAIAHIHVRDPETGKPAFKVDVFRIRNIGQDLCCDCCPCGNET